MSEAPCPAIDAALQVHQSGDLPRAEQLYRRILRVDPYHADALHLLGVVAFQQGRAAEAVDTILQALSVRGKQPLFLCNLGAAYRALGQLDDAIECFQQAVQLAPTHHQGHYNLALALSARSEFLGAQSHIRQTIEIQPRFPEAWNELGNICRALGDLDQAATAYLQALDLQPQFAAAAFNLGNLRLIQDRTLEAIACYARALRIDPRCVEALNNLGTALNTLGRSNEAIEAYRIALRLKPDFDEAQNNQGLAFSTLGQYEEALACLERALEMNPHNAAAHNNLGTVYSAVQRVDEAVAEFREAARLKPDFADAYNNLGVNLQLQGNLAEAEWAYTQTLALNPRQARARVQLATMLPPIYESAEDLLLWRERIVQNVARLHADQVTLDPSRSVVPNHFYLAYQGFNDRDLQRAIADLCGDPAVRPAAIPGSAPRRDGRLRVGFLSKYFKNHTIGALSRGLIAELWRSNLHVSVLSLGTQTDETAQYLQRHCDQWIVLPDQVAAARQLVAGLQLDVLFYPDVGMDPLSYTLACSRLAPVQCVTWGHPVTTGLRSIDYFLSSELLEIEEADAHYTESLVRLSTLPTFFFRPELPTERLPREALGLAKDVHVYLCPQSLFKIHPDFDPMVREILERDPRGRLVLIEAPQAHWTHLLQERWRRALGAAFGRVQWLPRQDQAKFLQLIQAADVMLDPPHFGGGHTTYQGFAAGCPIVTLPSNFMRGRVTAACYRKMDLGQHIATTTAHYIEQAVSLGTDQDHRAHVSSQIRDASDVLFEDRRAVQEIEAFLLQAAARAREGRRGQAA